MRLPLVYFCSFFPMLCFLGCIPLFFCGYFGCKALWVSPGDYDRERFPNVIRIWLPNSEKENRLRKRIAIDKKRARHLHQISFMESSVSAYVSLPEVCPSDPRLPDLSLQILWRSLHTLDFLYQMLQLVL